MCMGLVESDWSENICSILVFGHTIIGIELEKIVK